MEKVETKRASLKNNKRNSFVLCDEVPIPRNSWVGSSPGKCWGPNEVQGACLEPEELLKMHII